MHYIGIDYHKQYFVATKMDRKGKIISKQRVSTDRDSIRNYFNNTASKEKVKVAIEACYGWQYFYDEVSDLVDEIIMAHPLKTRLIAEARIKTDSIDSETFSTFIESGPYS